MARVTAPLLSMDASGSVGKTLTFAKWKGRQYVRGLVIPANPNTDAQIAVRASMKFLTQDWKNLSGTIQGHWEAAAKTDNITPLNAFVRQNQKAVRAGKGPIQDPTFVPGAVEAAPGAPGALGQYKQIIVTWTDSAGANDWCTMVWASKTNGFTPSAVNLIAIVPKGEQTFTHTGLTTGDTWYYQVAGVEHGSTIGTHSAQFTATVL